MNSLIYFVGKVFITIFLVLVFLLIVTLIGLIGSLIKDFINSHPLLENILGWIGFFIFTIILIIFIWSSLP